MLSPTQAVSCLIFGAALLGAHAVRAPGDAEGVAAGRRAALPGSDQAARLVFTDLSGDGSAWDLFSADGDGHARTRLTSSAGLHEFHPAASPGGAELAFVGMAPGPGGEMVRSVFGMPAGGGPATQLSSGPDDDAPAWRPDGGAVAFASRFADVSAIAEVEVASGTQRPLTQLSDDRHHLAQPAWRPDGTALAVVVHSDDWGGALWLLPPGGVAYPLFDHPGWDDVDPAWSPDGRLLAFASGPFDAPLARHDLWLLDTAAGTAGTIAVDPAHDLRNPAWSPDGGSLVVERRVPGSQQGALIKVAWPPSDIAYLTSGREPAWLADPGTSLTPSPPAPPTDTGSATPGATATVTEGPPVPSFPPPPETPLPFPTQATPEATARGPAPTFPRPKPTATATGTTETTVASVFVPAAANRPTQGDERWNTLR